MSVSKERIKELLDAETKLQALENGGVDNWEGYSFALEDYHKAKQFEDDIEGLVGEIMEIVCEFAYEPSERGAGIAIDSNGDTGIADLIRKFMRDQKDKNN